MGEVEFEHHLDWKSTLSITLLYLKEFHPDIPRVPSTKDGTWKHEACIAGLLHELTAINHLFGANISLLQSSLRAASRGVMLKCLFSSKMQSFSFFEAGLFSLLCPPPWLRGRAAYLTPPPDTSVWSSKVILPMGALASLLWQSPPTPFGWSHCPALLHVYPLKNCNGLPCVLNKWWCVYT